MQQIDTHGSLGNNLSLGDQNILNPIEDVADLELVEYNKSRHTIVK
jgi:hypothetical protein